MAELIWNKKESVYMQSKKPRPRAKSPKPNTGRANPIRTRNLQAKRNLTMRMLEALWGAAQDSSDMNPLPAKDNAMLSGIRNRLLENPRAWTIADYTNVLRAYKRFFGKNAKPE
jgi:hypothetical protein